MSIDQSHPMCVCSKPVQTAQVGASSCPCPKVR